MTVKTDSIINAFEILNLYICRIMYFILRLYLYKIDNIVIQSLPKLEILPAELTLHGKWLSSDLQPHAY